MNEWSKCVKNEWMLLQALSLHEKDKALTLAAIAYLNYSSGAEIEALSKVVNHCLAQAFTALIYVQSNNRSASKELCSNL